MADTQGDIYISQDSVLSGSNIPSSPEVVVRTMASDLASISQGGGSAPRGETVQGASLFTSSGDVSPIRAHSRGILFVLITFGILITLGILVFIGYYVVKPFLERPVVSVPVENQTSTPTEIFQ